MRKRDHKRYSVFEPWEWSNLAGLRSHLENNSKRILGPYVVRENGTNEPGGIQRIYEGYRDSKVVVTSYNDGRLFLLVKSESLEVAELNREDLEQIALERVEVGNE